MTAYGTKFGIDGVVVVVEEEEEKEDKKRNIIINEVTMKHIT